MLPVSGTLKYKDGTPVTGELATIVFQPSGSGEASKSASGTIQSDGSFELMTAEPGDGVQAGEYKVVLKVYSNYRQQKLAVAKIYAEEDTTPLSVTVDGSNTHFDLSVDR